MMQATDNSLRDLWVKYTGGTIPCLLYASLFVIIWGWTQRDQGYISAERGLGYWLGIIGGSLMLLLLTYSLRKRMRSLRRSFSIKAWFQFHMAFGIIGPVCVLFHSNFQWGSLNSSVALACMLLVAGSGIIGRFLYTRIHSGLNNEKVRLNQLMKDFSRLKETILKLTKTEKQNEIIEKIFGNIDQIIKESASRYALGASLSQRERIAKAAEQLQVVLGILENQHAKSRNYDQDFQNAYINLREYSRISVQALKKVPGLQLSERLFSIWHFLHIPIFFLMLTTVITHIIVVHMY